MFYTICGYLAYRKSQSIIPVLEKCKMPGVLKCYQYILKCVKLYDNDVEKCEELLNLEFGDLNFSTPLFWKWNKKIWIIKRNKMYFFLVLDKDSLRIKGYGDITPSMAGYVVNRVFSQIIWTKIKGRVIKKLREKIAKSRDFS